MTTLAEEILAKPRDKESNVMIQQGQLVYLTRAWSGFPAGEVFYVVAKMIPCLSGPTLRWNLRAVTLDVYESGQQDDAFFHRTLPAEICGWTPKVGESFDVWRNQGNREAMCIGRIGTEYLVAYIMPAGRWYLSVSSSGMARYRPVSLKGLPQKWRDNEDVQIHLNNLGIE